MITCKLKNGPKHFIVGKEEVERVLIDPRKELTGKHIDTKIEFKVGGGKILIHAYNTKQKMIIQGKKYKWFVDNYLEPFLKRKILSCLPQIEETNKTVLEKLKTNKRKPHSTEKQSLDEEAEIITCDKCTFTTTIAECLREHIISHHTVNVFRGLDIQRTKEIEHNSTLE